MAVNIDVSISEQAASVNVPKEPASDLSTSSQETMAQEIEREANMTLGVRGNVVLRNNTDGVTYSGNVDNFSNVKVGVDYVGASGASDTLELIAGDGIELEADVNGKTITITFTGGGSSPYPRLGYDTVDDVTYLSVLEE